MYKEVNKENEKVKHETIYWGNSCVTRYWVWNEEHNCISYGKMKSVLDGKKDAVKEES